MPVVHGAMRDDESHGVYGGTLRKEIACERKKGSLDERESVRL